jgi:hypothetical protein
MVNGSDKAGLSAGLLPQSWNVSNPDCDAKVASSYVEAGAQSFYEHVEPTVSCSVGMVSRISGGVKNRRVPASEARGRVVPR